MGEAVATEPTIESFMAKLCAPTLRFGVPNAGIPIPPGLLSCCRVLHAPGCSHHIAGTVLVATYTLTGRDGDGEAWTSERSSRSAVQGDLLADENHLWGIVEAAWMYIKENARIAEGTVAELEFGVFSLGSELWAEWVYLDEQRKRREGPRLEALRRDSDDLTNEQLEALPILALEPDDPDDDEQAARRALTALMVAERFRPTQAYAHRILTVPGEIGHDDRARYVVPGVRTLEDERPTPWVGAPA